jgi:hypothetical protein
MLLVLGPIGIVIANFERIKTAVADVIGWIASNWGSITDVLLAPIDLVLAGYGALKEGLTGTFTAIRETVSGIFGSIKDSIAGALDWVWDKISWVIAKIPDVLLPESLKNLKAEVLATPKVDGTRKAGEPIARPVTAGSEVKSFVTTREKVHKPIEGTFPIGKSAVVPVPAPVVSVSTPAVQTATPSMEPIQREPLAMPSLALAGAGAGPVDQSIHIGPGAIVIHATKIDETAALRIDRELAKLLERRRERK